MALIRIKSYINFRMLLRVIGWLLSIEALFMLVPFVVGLIYKETAAWKFLFCLGGTGAVGLSLMSLRPKSREMGKREAILLTGLTWIILSFFGMTPFLFCGVHLSVTDAFFETMSGFTTTGATVLNSFQNVSHSILIWRCIVQWIGGLGIILFTLAVLPMLNYQGGIQLFNAEVTGITHDKLRPRVSFTAQSLWLVYIGLTTFLIFLLSLSRMSVFDAICYGLSTMSTGGFSINDTSVVEQGGIYVKIILTIFMFLGGVNFALIYKLMRGDYKSSLANDALRCYIGIIVISYLLLCLNILIRGLYHDISDITIDPLFQAVSILSSTGLTEPDFRDWGPLAVIVLIVLMFMGACAGSTSGGAKIDRFIILFRFLKNEFYKMMHPNSVTTVTINGKGTPSWIVMKTLAFLFLFVIVIVIGGTILVLLGMPLKDSFFIALSAVANTGLGTDITGISGNYSLVPDAGKWIIAFIMLVGRLELYTILLLFTPTFWKK